MIDERDVREMLLRRADAIAAAPRDPAAALRRGRRRMAVTVVIAITTAATLLVGAIAGVGSLLRTAPRPADRDDSPVLPSAPSAWSAVEPPGGRIWSITAGGPGLVAVGSIAADGSGPAIWTSADGRSWTAVEGDIGASDFHDVTTGGPGLVAISIGNRGYVPQVGIEAPVWYSTDGLAWTQAPPDPVFEGAFLHAISAGGPGLVVVGADREGPQAWFSADGVTWELASVPPVPDGVHIDEDHAEAWMQDVAVAGDRLVAVGTIAISMGPNSYRYDPVMWTSTDGTTWVEVDHDPDVFTEASEFRGAAAGPAGFVVVGQHDQTGSCCFETPGVWWSADGLAWSSVSQGQDSFVADRESDFGVHAVAAGAGGYVAVGLDSRCRYAPRACTVAETAVWVSADGRSWARVSSDPVFRVGRTGPILMRAVAAWGSRFVAAGEYWAYEGEPPEELRNADWPSVLRYGLWISDAPADRDEMPAEEGM